MEIIGRHEAKLLSGQLSFMDLYESEKESFPEGIRMKDESSIVIEYISCLHPTCIQHYEHAIVDFDTHTDHLSPLHYYAYKYLQLEKQKHMNPLSTMLDYKDVIRHIQSCKQTYTLPTEVDELHYIHAYESYVSYDQTECFRSSSGHITPYNKEKQTIFHTIRFLQSCVEVSLRRQKTKGTSPIRVWIATEPEDKGYWITDFTRIAMFLIDSIDDIPVRLEPTIIHPFEEDVDIPLCDPITGFILDSVERMTYERAKQLSNIHDLELFTKKKEIQTILSRMDSTDVMDAFSYFKEKKEIELDVLLEFCDLTSSKSKIITMFTFMESFQNELCKRLQSHNVENVDEITCRLLVLSMYMLSAHSIETMEASQHRFEKRLQETVDDIRETWNDDKGESLDHHLHSLQTMDELLGLEDLGKIKEKSIQPREMYHMHMQDTTTLLEKQVKSFQPLGSILESLEDELAECRKESQKMDYYLYENRSYLEYGALQTKVASQYVMNKIF